MSNKRPFNILKSPLFVDFGIRFSRLPFFDIYKERNAWDDYSCLYLDIGVLGRTVEFSFIYKGLKNYRECLDRMYSQGLTKEEVNEILDSLKGNKT
jgi:hypothetical protein